jgi:hypothetical protein
VAASDIAEISFSQFAIYSIASYAYIHYATALKHLKIAIFDV